MEYPDASVLSHVCNIDPYHACVSFSPFPDASLAGRHRFNLFLKYGLGLGPIFIATLSNELYKKK